MSRTPFGTPFRRRRERFPDQTRPDQSLLVVLLLVVVVISKSKLQSVARASEIGFGGAAR